MAFLTPQEIIDIIIMCAAVGYIFKDSLRPRMVRKTPEDWIKNVTPKRGLASMSNFWYSILAVAPAIILHEFGHKFTAIYYGLEATFHASYTGLLIGVVFKTLFGWAFFIPAYVSFPAVATPLQHLLIAFAGPAINGLLWLIAHLLIKSNNKFDKETLRFLAITRYINGFLFILNMIPIPGFDGYHFFANLLTLL